MVTLFIGGSLDTLCKGSLSKVNYKEICTYQLK